ncbi:MAG: 30S ribosomal protein S27e [Thermoplasmatota archaeon]
MHQRAKFLKVRCGDCSNEQVIFDHAASQVKCAVCGALLAEPRGGESLIKAEVLATLE